MPFNLSKEQLYKFSNMHLLPEFEKAEMLFITFKTDSKVCREILPKQLSPSSDCLATVFVAKYPKTSFGSVYNEGALFLHCEYKGERGSYCLSMPVDDDMALIGGREQFGYPKKMADKITLKRNGNTIIGSVIRKGVEIIHIECELTEKCPSDFTNGFGYPTTDWDGVPCVKMISFLFKSFPNAGGSRFDYFPRLIRAPVLFRPCESLKTGFSSIKFQSTSTDPLAEVSVGEITNAAYGQFNNTMLPGKVMSRVWNILEFAKHAFFKSDFAYHLLKKFDPNSIARAKEILKKAKKY